jgi:tetratricopeptide (TPR) repeat protein
MSNAQENTKKDYTLYIIIGIIVLALVILLVFTLVDSSRKKAAVLFEKAYEKLDEFDELPNIYSKQEMEKEVLGSLDQVIAKYPNTVSGQRARYYKGYVYFNTQKYEKALSTFEYFIKNNKNSYLIPKAYYFLSYCYSETDNFDKAIAALELFEKNLKDSYFTPLALYRLAKLYEVKKNKDKAINYYEKLVNDYSQSSKVEDAKQQILMLKNEIEL